MTDPEAGAATASRMQGVRPDQRGSDRGAPLAQVEDSGRLSVEIGSPHLARVGRVALLVAVDALVLLAVWTAAYLTWARPVHGQPVGMYLELAPLMVLFFIGFAQAGLYPGFGLGPVETLRRTSYVTAFGFVLLSAASFAMKLPHLYSRATFGIAFLLCIVLVPLVRFAVARVARRSSWWREPVVLVGTGPRVRRAASAVQGAPALGYRPIGALVTSQAERERGLAGIPVLGTVADADAEALAKRGIRVAILEVEGKEHRSVVDDLQRHFRHVIILREFEDLPVEGVEIRNFGGFLGVEYTNNLLKRHNRVIKRTMDLVLGAAALLVALPVMAVAALAVSIASPGPPLYRQHRYGRHGAPLPVTKIRTMRPDADLLIDEYLAAGSQLREEWQQRRKLADDPRLIPGVGRLLRRWSIDELPQLWSVVTGRMSLVGPRPLPEYHLEEFSSTFRELRERVRPGVTGMWQVMIRSDGGKAEQEAFDSYYIRNWSVWLDVYVLAKTVSAVWTGRGAY